jgi:asparagine synthase (glutamine-hydrolysing)
MCGIAGFLHLSADQRQAQHLIEAMCQVIRHRGPDAQGTWCDETIALGARRLAIIDRQGGQQPIFNEDGSILVVFNGELYNYRQLREQLERRGHRFCTQSDTEVLVHAYEEHGTACPQHLRGMFAFALWDRSRQRLLLARDRFGKKPLHYFWDGQRLLFASEIKALLQADIPRQLNHQALDEFLLYRYVPSPHTLFAHIYKLPAAHTLVYERGELYLQRYWDLSFAPTCHDDAATAIARTRALLEEAVQVRLMSEVPLGAFLSGGLDSSVVVGLMSHLMEQPVKTFAIGFEEDAYNELPYARRVAQHFGTQHHEFVVRPDLVSVLPHLVRAYDEPFADSSMLPTYYVSKLAREHVTVVLSGDGGDEIFAGYRHYQREHFISYIPGFICSMFSQAAQLMPDGMQGKGRLSNLHQDLGLRYVHGTMVFPSASRLTMFTSEYFAHIRDYNPYARQAGQFAAISHLDVVAQMQCIDIRNYLVDDILVKVDRASMFNSLETRAPLLDHLLAEYVCSLQPALRMRHGTLKYLLKQVAADIVPPDILARKKQGFAVPIERWFRGSLADYAHDTLLSLQAQQRGIFNPRFVSNLLKAHTSTRLINHSAAIWTLLCLELWFQTYMDGRNEVIPDDCSYVPQVIL